MTNYTFKSIIILFQFTFGAICMHHFSMALSLVWLMCSADIPLTAITHLQIGKRAKQRQTHKTAIKLGFADEENKI